MKLFTVINYTRTNNNLIFNIAPNQYTTDIIIASELSFVHFLCQANKMPEDGIESYFQTRPLVNILYDMYDFVLYRETYQSNGIVSQMFNKNFIQC